MPRKSDAPVGARLVHVAGEFHRLGDWHRRRRRRRAVHPINIQEGEDPEVAPEVDRSNFTRCLAKDDEFRWRSRVVVRAQAQLAQRYALLHGEAVDVEADGQREQEPALDGLSTPDGEYLVVCGEDAVALSLRQCQVGVLCVGAARRGSEEQRRGDSPPLAW